MSKIYWAAPLHDERDRKRNEKYVAMLRKEGHQVYVPQEHGVWEELAKKLGNSEDSVRKYLFTLDLKAMKEADVCVACCGNMEHQREPSEGMLWEMGWMSAANKTVILFNENNYWRFNLMPQFGSIMRDSFDDILEFLRNESFV